MYCTINVKMDDDSFNWINRYMQEKKLIEEDRNLRCSIKKAGSKNWWEEISRSKMRKLSLKLNLKQALEIISSNSEAKLFGCTIQLVKPFSLVGKIHQQSQRNSMFQLTEKTLQSSNSSLKNACITVLKKIKIKLQFTSCTDGGTDGPKCKKRSQDHSSLSFWTKTTQKCFAKISSSTKLLKNGIMREVFRTGEAIFCMVLQELAKLLSLWLLLAPSSSTFAIWICQVVD